MRSVCIKIPLINNCMTVIIIILILGILGCPGSDQGPLKDSCSFNITIAICVFTGLSLILSIGHRCWLHNQPEREFTTTYYTIP